MKKAIGRNTAGQAARSCVTILKLNSMAMLIATEQDMLQKTTTSTHVYSLYCVVVDRG